MITIRLTEHKSNVASLISWPRLVEELRISKEIQPNERVTHLEIDEVGIRYYVEIVK